MDTFSIAIFLLVIMIAASQAGFWPAAALMLLLAFALRHSGILVLTVLGLSAIFLLQAESTGIYILAAIIVFAIVATHQKGGGGYSPQWLMGG